jgi:hypothetical protein
VRATRRGGRATGAPERQRYRAHAASRLPESPAVILRRVLSRLKPGPDTRFAGQLEKAEDAHPKDGLFTPPVRVADLRVAEPEHLDGGRVRVTFVATIRDAEDRRCPDLSVEARVAGPERTGGGQSTTDLMGSVKIRMTGPPGDYRCEIVDVAAGGLSWDLEASTLAAETTVAGG